MAAEVLMPASAEEAAASFGDGAGITVFAGGTILLPEIAAGRVKPERALMLHRSGLDRLATENGTGRIGAMVSLEALVDSSEAVLARCAAGIANAEVRRGATVGGNLCASPGQESQRGDLGAPLIALGARVRSVGAGGERVEPVEDFVGGDRGGRLVLDIEYDRGPRTWAVQELRRRHADSYAIATVAVCAAADGELRVGVSGAGPVAVRCRTVEQSREPGDVLKDVETVDDAVASAAYRRTILPVLLRRAFVQLEAA